MPEPKRISTTNELVPELKRKAAQLVALAETEGIHIKIIETLRTDERQAHLFAKGRTTPGPQVTKVSAGRSWHNHRRAFDYVVLDENGKADWEATASYNTVGELGKQLGLEWGGDFHDSAGRPIFDLCHFQFTRLSIGDAVDLALARDLVDRVHRYLGHQQPVDGGEA